jgi:hypothetical protein
MVKEMMFENFLVIGSGVSYPNPSASFESKVLDSKVEQMKTHHN